MSAREAGIRINPHMSGMGNDASRRRAISAAQWVAARALSEGAPATRARVAAALGCDVSSLYGRAAAEGWRCVNFRGIPRREAWEHFIRVAHGEASGDGADPLEAAGFLDDQRGADESGVDRAFADPDVAGVGGIDLGSARPDAADPDWAEHGDVAQTAIGRVAQGVAAGAADGAGVSDGAGGAAEIGGAGDGDDDPREMLARGARFLSRRLSRLMRQAERGGAISKQEIDNLTAMTRMMDRWETLAKERVKQDETDRDAKVAEALRKIDRRILKLAREEAERLVAARGSEGDRDRNQ
jgi:hypothetical protein